MPDVFTKAKRSEVMSRIRGKHNASTELRLIEIMRSGQISGWRRHQQLPGRPDFAFRKQRVAVFVDGCFWHCCPKCGNLPKNNAEFWRKKLLGNKERDRAVCKELRSMSWLTLRLWEHELDDAKTVLVKLKRALAKAAARANAA